MKHRIQTQPRFPIRSRSEAKSITHCLLFGTDPADMAIAEYQLVRALPEPLDTCLPSIEQIEAELGRNGDSDCDIRSTSILGKTPD